MSVIDSRGCGFYGKLPSHGDFLTRGLSGDFVTAWDDWLQRGMIRSQEVLGEGWLDAFLTSPVWRFVLAPGAIDHHGYAGILFPSVDRVGRYFPMTAARRLSVDRVDLALLDVLEPWQRAAETVLLAALERDENDLEELVRSICPEIDSATDLASQPHLPFPLDSIRSASHWRIALEPGAAPGRALAGSLFESLAAAMAPLTIWWSGGSTNGGPSLRVSRGLPDPELFAEMISNDQGCEGGGRGESGPVTGGLEESVGAIGFRASSATTAGWVRANNEDSYCERTAEGIWAVSDGIGGQSHGEVASRMVTDAVALVTPTGSLDSRADQIRRSLGEVNAELRRLARTRSDGFNAGATVLVLVASGARAALIWAGDSRGYRLREDVLEVLTTDHTDADPDDDGARSHVITRAVGGDELLELDVRMVDLLPGDRILLCSDGVHGELSSQALRSAMGGAWTEKIAPNLLDRVLQGAARDNATAVVVECSGVEHSRGSAG